MCEAYRLLDFGNGRRLEQWGPVRLARPDARAVGQPALPTSEWAAAAEFHGRATAGRWHTHRDVPDSWTVRLDGLTFAVHCAPSGHTGLFPEQASNWTWMRERLASRSAARVLNLFAYTGGASVALARAGHHVTHVDASRPVIGWARRNAALNDVTTIRWIHDDARRFVGREVRRKRRYDALLLDPPAFGRGPAGPWQLAADLPPLLAAGVSLLVETPAFVFLNLYDSTATAEGAASLLRDAFATAGRPVPGTIACGTVDLTAGTRPLATGVFARCPDTMR